MVTVFVHGEATQAVYLNCDPFPGSSVGPTVLRIRWKAGDVKWFDGSLVPVVFEFAGTFYEGMFRQVARSEQEPGEIACTLISEGPIKENTEARWREPLRRLLKWRSVFEPRDRTR
jgi:hypothetical protein